MLIGMAIEQAGIGGEGSGAAAVTDKSRRPAWQLTKRTATGAWHDNIFTESAAGAFWQVLSLPPLLLGVMGSLGYIGDWFGADTASVVKERIVALASGVFSGSAVNDIIAPTVTDILTTARSELISIGFLISLWSGSSAMSAFVDAISRAHGQYEVRNSIWQRMLALLLYVAGLITVIITAPLLTLGPERLVGVLPDTWRPFVSDLITWFYLPAVALLLLLALTTLYKVALPRKLPWHRGLPGAVLAAAVFLTGATGLRLYLDWLTGTGYTYGALGAPIAFLLATFFIGLAIILGAHLNAAIEELWPSRRSQPEPQRGAVKAADQQSADGGDGNDGSAERDVDQREAVARRRRRAPQVVQAINADPEIAVMALERLDYVVIRPVGVAKVAD